MCASVVRLCSRVRLDIDDCDCETQRVNRTATTPRLLHAAWLTSDLGSVSAQERENRIKRRGRDSNPRNSCPFTRFPVAFLRPLGHLSGFGSSWGVSVARLGCSFQTQVRAACWRVCTSHEAAALPITELQSTHKPQENAENHLDSLASAGNRLHTHFIVRVSRVIAAWSVEQADTCFVSCACRDEAAVKTEDS